MVGVEKHHVSSASARNRYISKQIQQHRRLRPCCSHPIPSHPIPSRPIPRVRHTRRTRTANTRSEHTQREDETRRQTPREYRHDDHVPGAKACPAKASQVSRRPTDQPRRDANTQASAADPLALHGRTRTLTTARTQVSSAKACQVPGRAKCQGVVQESAKARVRACKGRLGMGWVWAADAGGRERR